MSELYEVVLEFIELDNRVLPERPCYTREHVRA